MENDVTILLVGHINNGDHTVYVIQTQVSQLTFEVNHRFREIDEFHKQLIVAVEGIPYINQKWHNTKKIQPPPKHRLTSSSNDAFINSRKEELQVYFNQLSSIPGITGVDCFIKFFNIKLNAIRRNISYCGVVNNGNLIAAYVANLAAGKLVDQLVNRIVDDNDESMAFVYQGFWVNQYVYKKSIYLCLTMAGFDRNIIFNNLARAAENNIKGLLNDNLLEEIIKTSTE